MRPRGRTLPACAAPAGTREADPSRRDGADPPLIRRGAVGATVLQSGGEKGPLLALRLGTAVLIAVMAWVTWYLPQVTLQQGVAGFGLVCVAYVMASHELLKRTRLPVTAEA